MDSRPRDARYRPRVASAGTMPAFAPISVVMFDRTNRSFIGKPRTVSPWNSTALYAAPSSPVAPPRARPGAPAPRGNPPQPPRHVRVAVRADHEHARADVAALDDELVD